MKQYFILFAILFGLFSNVQAQRKLGGVSLPKGAMSKKDQQNEESKQLDSLGYNVKSVIRTWKLTRMNSDTLHFDMDTVLGEIQNFNPIYQQSISNSFLGNLGSPYQSNIYIDRVKNEGFLFLNPYRAYLLKPEDNVYFNTTTPYTRLFYALGGSKGTAENLLRAEQTQNISPNWNIGINYDLISSDGQYQNQKAKVYDFTLFSSYSKRNYSLYTVLAANRLNLEENGGVVNDTLITKSNEAPENIQVNLDEAKSNLTNFNFFMNHSYGFGGEKEIVNDQDTSYSYAMNFLYTFNYTNNSWKYTDAALNKDYFNNFYLNESSTFDKVKQSIIENTAQIVFNENENKWIRLGARFGLSSELIKYNLRRHTSVYSWQQVDENIHNNQLIASIYSRTGKYLNWTASAKFVFEGYRQNDLALNYELTRWIGEKNNGNGFHLEASYNTKTPDYIFNEYYGNNQQWNINLDPIKELQLKGEFFSKPHQFKIGVSFNRIDNYTYFGLSATPEQVKQGISVLTGYLEKNFTLGHFNLNQKLVGQNTSDDQRLALPKLSVYSNNYYKNEFFNGALGFQTGFSVRYNTAFYAPDYMPSIGQFFIQNQKEIGDYPKIDVYVNFRIKRTRLFFMYEHANASIGSKNYFSALHYPINPSMFKYGLIWTFYN